MLSSTLRKVFRDFTSRWGRSLLTIVGLAIGLFGVASVVTAFIILSNDMTANFTDTNPPNVIVTSSSLEPETARILGTIPGAIESEERRLVYARLQIGEDRWVPAVLHVIEDFEDMRIAKVSPESGAWPASEEGFLLERDGRWFLTDAFGTTQNIRLPNGEVVELTYEGMAHDAGQAQSRMEGMVYLYVRRATYDSWGLEGGSRTLITVANPDEPAGGDNRTAAQRMHNMPMGQSNAEFVAEHTEPVLDYYGETFISSSVQRTDRHPHQFQLNSISGLLIGLMVTSGILCAALVINLTDSIMAAEVRQVGVMKALGGSRGQILRSYMIGIGVIGLAASLLSLSYAISFGSGVAAFIARALNFDILTEGTPLWLAPMIVAVGVLLPIVVAWFRVRQVTRISVREALQSDNDVQLDGIGGTVVSRLGVLPLIPRMALRNLVRNPRRSIMTIVAISIGLVTFLAAMNLRSSLLETIVAIDRTQLNDIRMSIYEPGERDELGEFFTQFDNVEKVELWRALPIEMGAVGETLGARQTTYLVPPDTDMIDLDVMRGSWLDNDRPNEIVVTQAVMNATPSLDVGSVYELRVGDWTGVVSIVGIVKEFGGGIVYVPESLGAAWGEDQNVANVFFIRLAQSSLDAQTRFSRQVQAAFDADPRWNVFRIIPRGGLQRVIEAHIDILVKVINIVAVTMLSVGALGLATSVGVSVMERRREVGVLKAVGGGSGAVRWVFMWEAIFTAVLGWALALILAGVPSRAIASTFGMLLVEYPFDYRAALWGPPIALAAAVGIAVVTSFLPARAATRVSVQSALQSV